MTRFFLRSRRLLAVSIMFLLAVVVSLSTATRRPCLHECSGPWRIWKAGHMTRAEGQEIRSQRLSTQANTPQVAPQVAALPPPAIYRPREEALLPAFTVVSRIHHFRAPPDLG
jgi:hypothetical protein